MRSVQRCTRELLGITMEATAATEAMAAIGARAGSCAHCGKQLLARKRCSNCKQVSYCGVECQKAGWRGHRKTCEPPLPLGEVGERVSAAHRTHDWRGVLKWEGRMEELLEGRPDASCNLILYAFSRAHEMGNKSTGSSDHSLSVVRLEGRRVELLGKLQRFRDQGEALCTIAKCLFSLRRKQETATYFKTARDLGAKHGFFSAESDACLGLGRLALSEGRHEEGMELLRNAVAAASLNESDDTTYERNAFHHLIEALIDSNEIDELEPLVARYREAALAESRKEGSLGPADLRSLCFSARLHEVPITMSRGSQPSHLGSHLVAPCSPVSCGNPSPRPYIHQGRWHLSRFPPRPSQDKCTNLPPSPGRQSPPPNPQKRAPPPPEADPPPAQRGRPPNHPPAL